MIVLNLCCRSGHRFEGWFASVESFDRQAEDGMLTCPLCNDREVSRLPSGPHVRRSDTTSASTRPLAPSRPGGIDALARLIADMEDVGERFPEEARRIHYEEVPPRPIRGEASVGETLDLLEEGVAVLPLPLPAKKTTH